MAGSAPTGMASAAARSGIATRGIGNSGPSYPARPSYPEGHVSYLGNHAGYLGGYGRGASSPSR